MDFPELAKVSLSRVQKVEPENASKILGCIFLREPDQEEMVQLAYGTDADLLAKIADAKASLAAIYARCSAQHNHQIGSAAPPLGRVRHLSPVAATTFGFHVQSQYSGAAALQGHYALQKHKDVDDYHYDTAVRGYYYASSTMEDGGRSLLPTTTRTSSRHSMRRPCHYFFKGNCKNGLNCHYSHSHQVPYDALDDEHRHHHNYGALGSLESEITELLHSRRGQPVSIASLPTLYGETYGKGLQADGYLTESQRHGKAGYSLTKLLSRLKKIRVIER